MRNCNAMLIKKQELVIERMNKIEVICAEIFKMAGDFDYKNIAKESQIPYSTLMRKRYRNIIDNWKKKEELNTIHPNDANLLRKENKHLNEIIKKLIKENHALKTKLYTIINE